MNNWQRLGKTLYSSASQVGADHDYIELDGHKFYFQYYGKGAATGGEWAWVYYQSFDSNTAVKIGKWWINMLIVCDDIYYGKWGE